MLLILKLIMGMIKLIIAGGRDFNDYPLLQLETRKFLVEHNFNPKELIIVSGNAKGADMLGERFAHQYKFNLQIFPADWNQFGKSAGPIRNEEMAKFGTHLLLFWDGQSRGSKNMLENAQKYELTYKIIKYEQGN